MRPRLFLAMGSAIVLLLIIIPPPAVAAAERYKVKACGRGRDRVLGGRLSRRAGGQRKITGGEIEPTITQQTRANLRNIIVTWQQEFSFGARTDFI